MKKQLPHGVSGIIIATVVLLAFVAIGIFSGTSAAPKPSKRAGKPAPAATFTMVDGSKVSLADLKGKVVLLNFWATWCGPCRAEMPDIIKLHNNYKDRGLVVLGLSADDNQAALDAFLKESPLPYPVSRVTREQGLAFDVSPIPTSILIDKSGTMVFDVEGYDKSVNFSELVEKYL
jgi:thiol-disulfide isomerase/thioredoxin